MCLDQFCVFSFMSAYLKTIKALMFQWNVKIQLNFLMDLGKSCNCK